MTVTGLVTETALGQANARRKEGLFVYCLLADKSVFQLCDLVCGRLEKEMKARGKLLAV